MRTQTIVVTRRCNQACGFCERVSHGSADPSFAALVTQIRAAVQAGARAVVLSGGEPTLRADLAALVQAARAEGAAEVTLETNGTRLDAAGARALRDAGVTAVQISLVTSHPERHAALVVLRAAGGQRAETRPQHIFRGIKACLDAGLPVSIRLPIAVGAPAAAARLAGLREAFPALRRFVLAPTPTRAGTLRPDQALAPEALAEELGLAYKAADRAGADVELAADGAPPPCLVDVRGDARRLFARIFRAEDGAPNEACPTCAGCALATRCVATSAQVEAFGGPAEARPVTDKAGWLHPGRSAGSRLRVLGAAEVETFYHVDYDYGDSAVDLPTSRLGIVYRCNQVCTFCELADMDTDVPAEKVFAAIDGSLARGSRRLIVTGGEPTLSPRLVEYVRYAHEHGFPEIELQTNAVLLDRAGLADDLRAAGLTSAQISLHGPDSAVSDRLTAAPGTHQRTLRGVSALLRAGVRVLLNHLVFKDNCRLLVDFVEMCAARWGEHKARFVIQFHSPRNEFSDRDEGLLHVARYSDYIDVLRRALDRAAELGIAVHDLQDPTGIPSLCVLGADERYLGPILAQRERPRLHAWESPWMTRVKACDQCDASPACMGVPRHYLALHGDAEFTPIRLDLPAAGLEPVPAPIPASPDPHAHAHTRSGA